MGGGREAPGGIDVECPVGVFPRGEGRGREVREGGRKVEEEEEDEEEDEEEEDNVVLHTRYLYVGVNILRAWYSEGACTYCRQKRDQSQPASGAKGRSANRRRACGTGSRAHYTYIGTYHVRST